MDCLLNRDLAKRLQPAVVLALSRLQGWELSNIRQRVQRRTGWSEEVLFYVEREYRRFISLAILMPSQMLGMAGPVDEFWHEHLLDTENYMMMCEDVVGTFVHHRPKDIGNATDAANYERTIFALKTYYGEAPEQIWPEVEGPLVNCSRCDRSMSAILA